MQARASANVALNAHALCQELLAFEAEGDVLAHTLGSQRLLMWPLVRYRLFEDAAAKALGIPPARAPRLERSWSRDFRYAQAVLRGDPLRIARHFNVLMFGSTLGVSVQRGGKWLGRINDYFALEYDEQTLVLDQSHRRAFRRPRAPRHVAAHDALSIRAGVRARLSPLARDAGAEAVERFARFLAEKLPAVADDEALSWIRGTLHWHASRARFLREGYLRLFDRLRPRVLFLEDASFGTQAHILKYASEQGVRTAEFQHGVITPTVLAYRYAEPLHASATFRAHLPEFLLTYGRFWSENTHTPSALHEIGNPHFELKRQELAVRAAGQVEPQLVIVSQADAAPALVPLACELARRLPSRTIVYRLHPAELTSEPVYAPLRTISNLRISDRGDIYELIAHAAAVVGVCSTALFEAAGLGRTVFIYDTPAAQFYVPRNFGHWFRNCDELVAATSHGNVESPPAEHYFAPQWQTRFRDFMRQTFGIS